MTLPYAEPLTLRDPAELTIPEPPRRGEEGGEPCWPCNPQSRTSMIWEDEHWTVHNPMQCSLPGTLWLASKTHFDSFADMPADEATTLAGVIGRVERAILATGDVGRVHLARWGEGGAHFHLWFLARPLGRLDMAGHALPVWEDALPARDQAEIDAIGEKIAAALVA